MSNVIFFVLGLVFAFFLVFKDVVSGGDVYYETREECVVEELSNCSIGFLQIYTKE